jgi:hypothetical protein
VLVALLPAFALDSFLPCHTYNSCLSPIWNRTLGFASLSLFQMDKMSSLGRMASTHPTTSLSSKCSPTVPNKRVSQSLERMGFFLLPSFVSLRTCKRNREAAMLNLAREEKNAHHKDCNKRVEDCMNCMYDRAKMNQVQMLATVPQARVDTNNSS